MSKSDSSLSVGAGAIGRCKDMMDMETTNFDAVVGRRCQLLKPVRDREGLTRFSEKPRILRSVDNLGRRMLLVQFEDGATTFLFPDEIVVE
jgi:hypothetical protein